MGVLLERRLRHAAGQPRRRSTSTTSTSSTAPTRSACRPTPQFRDRPQTSAASRSATADRRHGPARHAPRRRRAARARSRSPATTSTRPRRSPARPPRASVPAKRSRRWRRSRPQKLPPVDGLRLDRHRLPGEAGQRRGVPRVRPGRAAGLPGAGRPVRELAAAVGGDPGRAARAARRGRGRLAPRAWTTTSTRRSAWC